MRKQLPRQELERVRRQRVVCPTEKTSATLCLLAAQCRIVGVSGHTVRRRRPDMSQLIELAEGADCVADQLASFAAAAAILQSSGGDVAAT